MAGRPYNPSDRNDDPNKAALRDGYGVKRMPDDGVVPPGYHKIQAFRDPSVGGNYHWYRQDADGYWSSKPGHGEATDRDAGGSRIKNPMDANRNYTRGPNYSRAFPPLIAPN